MVWPYAPYAAAHRRTSVSVVANLPLLTDDDLELLFSGDSDGARRYRLLHAVLVRGMTQREAATEAHVSERTVRNVLRAYGRSGSLEVLRTRSGAARRRSRRAAAIEEALAQALAEEPLAGGDRLWRRAQELLGDGAGQLSRRTAYRMLAQLRTRARQTAPAELSGAVRSALPLMQEDPPLTLGASALAQRLLPGESDALARGLQLRQAMREAIERLRPAAGTNSLDRVWWPYLICKGEYEAGCNRTDLQGEFALSASTYSRAKRQALEKIAVALPQIVAQISVPAPALVLQRLPRTPDFVGRHEEENYYSWRLQTEGIAHLWGLPGCGKTVLAAELAARSHRGGRRVVWHTCAAGPEATLAGIVRGLAEGLAGSADDVLLAEVRQLGGNAGVTDALLEALRTRLLAERATLVLDDIHRAEAEETAALLAMLGELAVGGALQLLLVGRNRPAAGEWPELPGLHEGEALLLWSGAGALPEAHWQPVYDLTNGLPQPLRLAAAAYHRAGEFARLSDCNTAIEGWVQEAIWSQLDESERRVLAVLHILAARGTATAPAAICEVLAVPATVLETLQVRGLLGHDGTVRPLPALQHGAALLLREDAELRAAVERLTSTHASGVTTEVAAPTQRSTQETVPPAMDLLARVRRALGLSAEYLQSYRDDEVGRLVHELSQLQALLPDPRGPRPRPALNRRGDGRRLRLGHRQLVGQH
jgi:hypothetical protein